MCRKKAPNEKESTEVIYFEKSSSVNNNATISGTASSNDSIIKAVADLDTPMDVSLTIYQSVSSNKGIPDIPKIPSPFATPSECDSPSLSRSTSSLSAPETDSQTRLLTATHVFSIPKQKKGSKGDLRKFVDSLSKNEEAEITEFLARFFYGCNIPFSVVESDHFKNFIRKLRPVYGDKIPCRKALSSTLLENGLNEISKPFEVSYKVVKHPGIISTN